MTLKIDRDLKLLQIQLTENSKHAVTHWRVLERFGQYTLVEAKLETGRTHQIRVHMKYLGCPILGDSIYNKPDSLFPKATLMLHSFQLKIKLPGQHKNTTFQTKVPVRFKLIQKKLKEKFCKDVLAIKK